MAASSGARAAEDQEGAWADEAYEDGGGPDRTHHKFLDARFRLAEFEIDPEEYFRTLLLWSDDKLRAEGIPLGTRRWLRQEFATSTSLGAEVDDPAFFIARFPKVSDFLVLAGCDFPSAMTLSEDQMKQRQWPLGVRRRVLDSALLEDERRGRDALRNLPQTTQMFLERCPLGVRKPFLSLLGGMARLGGGGSGAAAGQAPHAEALREEGRQEERERAGGEREASEARLRQQMEESFERRASVDSLQLEEQLAAQQRVFAAERAALTEAHERECADHARQREAAEAQVLALSAAAARDAQTIKAKEQELRKVKQELSALQEAAALREQLMQSRLHRREHAMVAAARQAQRRTARLLLQSWRREAAAGAAVRSAVAAESRRTVLHVAVAALREAVVASKTLLLVSALRRLRDWRSKMCGVANSLQPLVSLEPPLPAAHRAELAQALRSLREGELDARARRVLHAHGERADADSVLESPQAHGARAPAVHTPLGFSPAAAMHASTPSTPSPATAQATPGASGAGSGARAMPHTSMPSPDPNRKGSSSASKTSNVGAGAAASASLGSQSSPSKETPASVTPASAASMRRGARACTPVEMLHRLHQGGMLGKAGKGNANTSLALHAANESRLRSPAKT